MISKLKITYLFLNLILFSLIFVFTLNKVSAQQTETLEEDFSNAENA